MRLGRAALERLAAVLLAGRLARVAGVFFLETRAPDERVLVAFFFVDFFFVTFFREPFLLTVDLPALAVFFLVDVFFLLTFFLLAFFLLVFFLLTFFFETFFFETFFFGVDFLLVFFFDERLAVEPAFFLLVAVFERRGADFLLVVRFAAFLETFFLAAAFFLGMRSFLKWSQMQPAIIHI